MSAVRLLLSAAALELLRERVLPSPLRLPPGFAVDAGAPDTGRPAARAAAADAELRAAGAVRSDGSVCPAVAADLFLLAAPELAVTVRARRPDLEATACVAVRGPLGAALLRTSPTTVQLSAFPAAGLADELARVVPAPSGAVTARTAETVPLDALLRGGAPATTPALGRLRATWAGALHATVAAGPRPGRDGGVVGSVEWALDAGGWVGLEPRPSVGGRPQVRLVPVVPGDLGSWVAPLAGAALA